MHRGPTARRARHSSAAPSRRSTCRPRRSGARVGPSTWKENYEKPGDHAFHKSEKQSADAILDTSLTSQAYISQAQGLRHEIPGARFQALTGQLDGFSPLVQKPRHEVRHTLGVHAIVIQVREREHPQVRGGDGRDVERRRRREQQQPGGGVCEEGHLPLFGRARSVGQEDTRGSFVLAFMRLFRHDRMPILGEMFFALSVNRCRTFVLAKQRVPDGMWRVRVCVSSVRRAKTKRDRRAASEGGLPSIPKES